jgi:hypothetical protein
MSTNQTHSQDSAFSNMRPSPDLMNAIGEELSELQSLAARFSDQVQQAAQTFSARLKLLEGAIAAQSSLPDSITIDAIHPAAETGFYDIEYEDSGWPFRWSGPSRDFSFSLKIDRNAPLRLRLHLIAMIDPKLQSDLLLLVDGVSVPIRVAEQEEGWFEYEAIIPAGAGVRETHLVIAVPCLLQPNNIEDPRLLGVAFRELRIFPVEEGSVETPLPVASPQDSVADLHENLRTHFPLTATASDTTKQRRRRRVKSAAGVGPNTSGTTAITDDDVLHSAHGTGASRPDGAGEMMHADVASGDGFRAGRHG